MMTDILALLKKSGSSDVYTSEEQKATSYSGNCNCGGGGNCSHCNCTHCGGM